MTKQYEAYLKSPEWQQLKLDLLMERGCKCQKCGMDKKPNQLHVHHLTYERIFKELATDLQLLCPKCHLNVHGLSKTGKPIKKKKPKKKKVQNKKHKKQIVNKVDAALQFRYDKLKSPV